MRAKRSRQLFQLTSSEFRAPDHVDAQWRLRSFTARDVPMMYWPDGRWCNDANRYMRELFERGLSRRNRGGSLRTEASNLSHFLRYCWTVRSDPADLTDSQFGAFMRAVAQQKHLHHPAEQARRPEAVVSIGRAAIALLLSIARHRDESGLVGPKGNIRAYERTIKMLVHRGNGQSRPRTVTYWHHKSFPILDAKRRRNPIATSSIQKMQGVVHRISTSPFLKLRRYSMLKLLEITGGRRAEVAALTVKSVREASAMAEPMLRMITLKRKVPKDRLVPVTRADIAFLLDYVDVHRRSVIRSTVGRDNDHDFFLISETSGSRLADNTITQEVAKLAEAAGLQGQSCAHMFRHRYITKLFVALIQQHELANPDDFRKMLLDSSAIRIRIMEATGHSNPESLNHYIDLAFEEIVDFKKVYDVVRAARVVENLLSTLRAEAGLLQGDAASPDPLSRRLVALTEAALSELEALKAAPQSSTNPRPS